MVWFRPGSGSKQAWKFRIRLDPDPQDRVKDKICPHHQPEKPDPDPLEINADQRHCKQQFDKLDTLAICCSRNDT